MEINLLLLCFLWLLTLIMGWKLGYEDGKKVMYRFLKGELKESKIKNKLKKEDKLLTNLKDGTTNKKEKVTSKEN